MSQKKYTQTKKIPSKSKIPTSSLPKHIPYPLHRPHISPSSSLSHHVPQQSSHSPVSQDGGGGFLSNLAGSVMQGIALGTGSQFASRTFDNVMGPREIQIKNVENDRCIDEKNLYNECIKNADSDISPCKNYMEMINKCNNSKN